MNTMNKIKSGFLTLPKDLTKNLIIEENFSLDNGKIANLAIIDSVTNELHSLWKLEQNIDKDNQYLHQDNNPFLECGTEAKFWIYSDGKKFILNDHAFIYPGDQYFDSMEKLFLEIRKPVEKRNL